MKKIIGIILIIVISLFILTGCTSQSNAEIEKRFIQISSQDADFKGYVRTVYDKETKVQYVYIYSSHKDVFSGLTVLVDAEGKPLLYEGE